MASSSPGSKTEQNLQLNGLEEVALLGLVGVLEEFSDLGPDVG